MNQTADKRKEERIRTFPQWWKRYYVYVVSSVIVAIVILVLLKIKNFWPFGDAALLNGDFALESWPYLMELKRKLASGESMLYSWGSGFGTSYFGIVTGILNPLTLFYLLLPIDAILPASSIAFIVLEIAVNISMLYYLTHRPLAHREQNEIGNMLFSLSYALCMYMVSNVNNWHLIMSAVLFPLVLLGLERFVVNQDWKLYYISLILTFVVGYYLASLFCLFIILYYLTLEFDSFKSFCIKSGKILLLSLASILTSAWLLLPAFSQLLTQNYTISNYVEKTWFESYFDVIKQFFAFNRAIDRGSAFDSYGEVNLYFGLLPLFLATLYFLNSRFKWNLRIRKLVVLIVYMLAFNLNGLNYVMHLFHYPSWFPNRFSLFFTIFCLILGYDVWVSMKESDYKTPSLVHTVLTGIGWVGMTIACFAFAVKIEYQFTYYYSIMIFLLYMVGILFLPYGRQKLARVLSMIGVVEILLCFIYAMIYRPVALNTEKLAEETVKADMFVQQLNLEEAHGFSRMMDYGDLLSTNQGMLLGYKGNTIFTSAIGNTGIFLKSVGFRVGGNVFYSQYINYVQASLLNIQYIYVNEELGDYSMQTELYSTASDLQYNTAVAAESGAIKIYEYPQTLSLGYMINASADEALSEETEQIDSVDAYTIGTGMNIWLKRICGVADAMEKGGLELDSVAVLNGQLLVKDENYFVSSSIKEEDRRNLTQIGFDGSDIMEAKDEAEYDNSENTVMRLDFTAQGEGEYIVQLDDLTVTTGYLHEGEEIHVFYEIEPEQLEDIGGSTGEIWVYRINPEQWQKAYDILSQQQMEVTSYTDTTVEGTINVKEDGLFFTSIPYDSNWHLYVDGVEREILPLWSGSFVAADLEAGEHTIHLEYRQWGLGMGILISIITLGGMILLMVLERKGKLLFFLERKKCNNSELLEVKSKAEEPEE